MAMNSILITKEIKNKICVYIFLGNTFVYLIFFYILSIRYLEIHIHTIINEE